MIEVRVQDMEGVSQQCCGDATDTNNNNRNSKSDEKYGLRPRTIIKRLQQERVRQDVLPKRQRTKSRPAPLSKYRRKTANARERHRMREINNAFESLRKVLPDAMEVQHNSSTMTKITTLRLAVSYIRALSEVLEDEGNGDLCALQNSLQNTIQNSIQSTLQESLGHSYDQPFQTGAPPPGGMSSLQYDPTAPQQNVTQLMDYYSASNFMSASSSPSTGRGSLGSASDLEDLLSDDSGLLEDNLDVFHDIPVLSEHDPLQLLLASGRDSLSFASELCD